MLNTNRKEQFAGLRSRTPGSAPSAGRRGRRRGGRWRRCRLQPSASRCRPVGTAAARSRTCGWRTVPSPPRRPPRAPGRTCRPQPSWSGADIRPGQRQVRGAHQAGSGAGRGHTSGWVRGRSGAHIRLGKGQVRGAHQAGSGAGQGRTSGRVAHGPAPSFYKMQILSLLGEARQRLIGLSFLYIKTTHPLGDTLF